MKKVIMLSTGMILILATMLIIGCGTDKDVIATVNGDDISIDNLNDYYDRYNWTFPTAEEEYNRRREIVDTMVITRLLVQAAYEMNIDKSDEIARVVLSNRDKFLLDALYQKHIASKMEPTEADMKQFYDQLAFKYRASHILLASLESANEVLEKVKSGENFDQMAFEHSIDPSAKRNRGDLGYFIWGAMVDEFQEATAQMEPGQVSPPVKSQFGYHIIKLVDKLENENRVSFEEMKPEITNKVKQRKMAVVSTDYFAHLKDKYPVKIDTTTCSYILHKRENLYPPQLLQSLPRSDFDLEQLDRDEKELVFATLESGQMTINEYLTQIKEVPVQFRPDLDDYDSLAAFVFEIKKLEILALEAVREGLDNTDEYIEKMKLFKELNMADVMRNDSMPSPAAPEEDEIRRYYEENEIEFTTPAKVHVFEILLSDELKARKLVNDIKSLKDFKSNAQDLTERAGFRRRNGDLDYFEREYYPEIFDLAKKTSIGEIVGPVVTQQKYSIFYVVDKLDPQLKDFLGVKRDIIEKITQQRKEAIFQAWLDEHLSDADIDINEELLWTTIDMSFYATPNNPAGN